VADWIVLLSGYDDDAVQDAASNRFSASALQEIGAFGEPVTGVYTLASTMSAQDAAAN
jgi:hypothetical protein